MKEQTKFKVKIKRKEKQEKINEMETRRQLKDWEYLSRWKDETDKLLAIHI